MLARTLGGFKKYADMFRQGWNDVPVLYASATLGIASVFILVIRVAHTPPGGYITRFKERYMVMRPEDDRLIGYPKDYITDNHLIKGPNNQ